MRIPKFVLVMLSVRLIHWGRVTHICVSKLTIIDSDNGLAPSRRQAIIWTSAVILLIGPLGINSVKYQSKFKHFHSRKCVWTCRLSKILFLPQYLTRNQDKGKHNGWSSQRNGSWISIVEYKLLWSFEINWVRQYLVNVVLFVIKNLWNDGKAQT